jgi:hypothetical protein
MVNEEIKAGLKNALDRGQPLNKAIQSLITAGYNPNEVQQAAQEMNISIIHHLPESEPQETKPAITQFQNQAPQQIPTTPQIQTKPVQQEQTIQKLPQQTIPATQTIAQEKPKKRMPKALWILIILLVLILLATVSFIFFGKQILDMFFPKV